MSFLALLLTNLFTIGLALWQRWILADLLWVYWAQSVAIGVFHYFRIRKLRRFSTEGFEINDRSVAPTVETRNSTAVFFAFHFGAFHLGYWAFLAIGTDLPGGWETVLLALCVALFLVNHRYSYRRNLERDQQRVRNIGALLFYPYARVLPMHLTLIFGLRFESSPWSVLLFLGLKTAADLIMHCVEHRGLV